MARELIHREGHVNTCRDCDHLATGHTIQAWYCPVWQQVIKPDGKACIYKNKKV